MNMQTKITRWHQVIFIPMDNRKIRLLLWSTALSCWISPWGRERVGVGSTVQTVGGRVAVDKLRLFEEGESLIYSLPSLGRANISTGIRVAQVVGSWFMSFCLMSQHVLLRPSVSDHFKLNLRYLHTTYSDSQVGLV